MEVPVRLDDSPRLSEAVADALIALIADEGLEPGSRLPTEKLLCERFQVSRAVIREAISRLKADGVVRSRQGSGAFVALRPGQGSFRLVAAEPGLEPERLRQLQAVFELRYLIETGAAELAAIRREAAHLERMRTALDHMRDALRARCNAAADDDAFHVAVAAASMNPQLERFQAFMGQQLSQSRLPTWSAYGHEAGRALEAHREHEAIHAAIEAGNPVAAREAAAAHLIGAARRLGLAPLPWRGSIEREGEEARND